MTNAIMFLVYVFGAAVTFINVMWKTEDDDDVTRWGCAACALMWPAFWLTAVMIAGADLYLEATDDDF